MPGYVIHLATLTEQERKNQDFVRGVLAPDILKKWYKIYNGDIFLVRAKYVEWAANGNLPSMYALEQRIAQKESAGSSNGMHYGLSSSPNLNAFLSDPIVDLSTPFWKGYLKHLLADLLLYKELGIKEKLNSLRNSLEKHPDAEKLYAAELARLHNDWDILNKLYINQYNISLPDEVLELNIVDFKTGDLVYVDKSIVDNVIKMLNLINWS